MISFFPSKHFAISLLLLLTILSSTGSILLSKSSKQLTATNQAGQPDAYMENIVATITNKQGIPALKIESPKMIHFANDDTTYIMRPRVTIYRQSPQPWYINSDYAKATHGIGQIVFSNNVMIHHPFDVANPNTTMTTTSLTVFPNKQQATTSEAITITQPDTVVHAIGMFANLNDGTVKLLSQAKGDYVPST
ncbi:MAG: hypothetical protein ACD_45C00217G0001 [uncultured bacterium]|nr:MAG: hypothetical protein ACD_45C00217G0001 [uncultured bacterium]